MEMAKINQELTDGTIQEEEITLNFESFTNNSLQQEYSECPNERILIHAEEHDLRKFQMIKTEEIDIIQTEERPRISDMLTSQKTQSKGYEHYECSSSDVISESAVDYTSKRVPKGGNQSKSESIEVDLSTLANAKRNDSNFCKIEVHSDKLFHKELKLPFSESYQPTSHLKNSSQTESFEFGMSTLVNAKVEDHSDTPFLKEVKLPISASDEQTPYLLDGMTDRALTIGYCDLSAETSCDKIHTRTVHTGEKVYKCDVCPFMASLASNLKVHKMIHTGEKPYKCDLCDYSTTTSSHLKTHKQKHTGERPYKCNMCNYSATQAQCLKTHMKIHTRHNPSDQCNSSDITNAYSERFIDCGNISAQRGENPSQTDKTGETFKCDYCNYSSATNVDLEIHTRTEHAGQRVYKCDVCSYTSTESRNLNVHKRIHTGEKPYKCNMCAYSARAQSNLTMHKRVHTGERPYKCDMCNYSTRSRSHLTMHKRCPHR